MQTEAVEAGDNKRHVYVLAHRLMDDHFFTQSASSSCNQC